MVERIVYFGPFNNNKKEELLQKSLDYLKKNKGNKFYYLLPNGELLKYYRRKFIETVENTFEVNVFTFDDIVNKIVENISTEEIGNPMKNAIIRDCLIRLSKNNEIEYYKDAISMDGFIKTCNSIIGEIKRSLISPSEYLETCPNIPSFIEIGKIYMEYEKSLKQLNLSDKEGDYLKSIEELKKDNSFLKDLDYIIIDEFYDFRPIEMSILKELTELNINIYINIPVKTNKANPITNITITELKKLGFQIEDIKKEQANVFEKLSSSLFIGEKDIFNNIKNLKLIKANSSYLEYKKIFEEIKLHYQQGTQLSDMAIVVTNNNYLESLFKVAKEERVSINRSKTTPLLDNSLIKEFLIILENTINRGSKLTIINRIKSMYFPLVEKGERESLEYIIRKQNFEDLTHLKKIVEEAKKLNFPIEFLESLKACINNIEDEINIIPETSSMEDYKTIFLGLLEKFEIDKLPIEQYKSSNDYQTFTKDLKVIEELRNIINQSVELSLVNENISLEEYFDSLKDYLEEIEIIEEPGNLMGVKIFDPINIRGFKNKIVFIVGLSQGNYPNLRGDNFFLKEVHQSQFKSMNIEFKSYEDRYNNESLKFASIISTCNKCLYLSYSGSSESEEMGIPSMFLDEIYALLQGDKVEDKIESLNINLDYIIKDNISKITNNKDLSNFLLHNYFNENNLKEEYYHIHNKIFGDKLSKVNSKLNSEIGRLSKTFDNYRGKLSEKEILEDINKNMAGRTYSISFLESYSKCPFYFLLNNYFKVEKLERDIEEYSPIDIGSIYHLALRWFYLKYSKEIKDKVINGTDFPNIDSLNSLRIMLENAFVEYGFDLNLNKNKIILESTIEKLVTFIIADINRLSNPKEKLLPYEFELEFGRKNIFEIEIDGQTIPMTGVIDRIDKLLNSDTYIVMDYKSSAYGSRNIDHMISGLSLQLPVYIMSQKEDIVVGLYGIIGSAKFDIPIGILEKSNIISKRHKGGINQEQWDELLEGSKRNILNNINGIKSGDFSVDPIECSPYCIYKDICRYEKILEVEEE